MQAPTDDEATLGTDHVASSVVLYQQGIRVIRTLYLGKSISTAVKWKRYGEVNLLFLPHFMIVTRSLRRGYMTQDIHIVHVFASVLQDLYSTLLTLSPHHRTSSAPES